MIKAPFEEPATTEWQKWKEDSFAATLNLVAKAAAGEKCIFNDKLYKRMKKLLFNAFHGKCAYCESSIAVSQVGDVEHFRPKARVADEDNKPLKVQLEDGNNVAHPGYYWLAYDWRNLLPSCILCNRLSKTAEGGLVGKGARFPVEGTPALSPGQEHSEIPMLLHPVLDDPEAHFNFDHHTGILGGLTDRGRVTIKILGLNREALLEARKGVYEAVWAYIIQAMYACQSGRNDEFTYRLDLIKAYKRGEKPYSFAGQKAWADINSHLRLVLE